MKTELVKKQETIVFDPRGGWNRYKFDADFFKKWSNEMAYVLGFLYADGCIIDSAVSARTQYTQFSSKDRKILEKIRLALKSKHRIYSQVPRLTLHVGGKIYKSSKLFCLRIGSRRMFSDLKKIGLTPNKSRSMKFPVIPPEYLNHFIRGYFDGDGSIFMCMGKGSKQQVIFKKALTVFSSGSKEFLSELAHILEDRVSTKYSRIHDGNRCFQIRYPTGDSVAIFKFMYTNARSLFLKRKFDIFESFFNERTRWLDNDVARILKQNKKCLAAYPNS